MATSTFYKNITIDKAAAERLIEILNEPVPPRHDDDDEFWEKNNKEVKEWLSRLER